MNKDNCPQPDYPLRERAYAKGQMQPDGTCPHCGLRGRRRSRHMRNDMSSKISAAQIRKAVIALRMFPEPARVDAADMLEALAAEREQSPAVDHTRVPDTMLQFKQAVIDQAVEKLALYEKDAIRYRKVRVKHDDHIFVICGDYVLHTNALDKYIDGRPHDQAGSE